MNIIESLISGRALQRLGCAAVTKQLMNRQYLRIYLAHLAIVDEPVVWGQCRISVLPQEWEPCACHIRGSGVSESVLGREVVLDDW